MLDYSMENAISEQPVRREVDVNHYVLLQFLELFRRKRLETPCVSFGYARLGTGLTNRIYLWFL